jgi:subtilisin family serine protease
MSTTKQKPRMTNSRRIQLRPSGGGAVYAGGEAHTFDVRRESEPDAILRTTQDAIDRRVFSPTILQEMRARGVAQVLVYMRTPVPQLAAASEEKLPENLRRCFVDSAMSSSYALRRALAPRSCRESLTLALSDESPADLQVYENLGIVLGTVNPDGLAALQAHDSVAAVTGSPQFSLIHPQEVSDVALADIEPWGAKALGVPRLWAEGLDGTGIVVGHLDTGVDGSHPALRDAIAAFTNTDALGNLRAAAPFDSGRHGTHTAGTIAGRTGNIAVAPGARLASAAVIEDPDIVRRILAGLNWVVGKGVRVISMSFGIRGYDDDFLRLMDSIRAKDILPVAAVGNEGPGTSRSPGNYANVLSVGAVDIDGKVWSNSSSQRFARAADPLVPDLVAPGVAILSALKGGGFVAMNGTSMAAPHIAGLAALLFQAKPDATAAQVEAAILSSCTLRAGTDVERANRGFPNAVKALALLTGTTLALSAGVSGGKKAGATTKKSARKVQMKTPERAGKRPRAAQRPSKKAVAKRGRGK